MVLILELNEVLADRRAVKRENTFRFDECLCMKPENRQSSD